jgi:hypothetical protein
MACILASVICGSSVIECYPVPESERSVFSRRLMPTGDVNLLNFSVKPARNQMGRTSTLAAGEAQCDKLKKGKGLELSEVFFSKKRIKKNSKKGCQLGKFREMGASRPLNGRKEASRQAQKKILGTSSRIRKFFLFAKRSLKQASRPATGRDAYRPASGRDVPGLFLLYFFLVFLFQKLFKIQSFFKYKIYSSYSYVCI